MVRAADFFASYTSADRAWAEWIAWQLEAKGYQVVARWRAKGLKARGGRLASYGGYRWTASYNDSGALEVKRRVPHGGVEVPKESVSLNVQ